MTSGVDGVTRLVVVGQGYVGLPLAVRACEVGFDVVGLDIDGDRVKRLGAGESTVEDISDDRLAAALATGRYRPTTDPADAAGFDVAVISVPTPLRDGNPDLSYIESAAAAIAGHVTEGCVVVLESTTYPGTTEELVAPDPRGRLGPQSRAPTSTSATAPSASTRATRTGASRTRRRSCRGSTPRPSPRSTRFYGRLVEQTVPVSGTKEAELTKLLENTFRHVNIALVNELAMFAHELGIDVWEAIDAAVDQAVRLHALHPGPGVGGHCLPIDPSYLSWRVKDSLGHTFRFVELANDVNDHMPDYVVRRLQTTLNERGIAGAGTADPAARPGLQAQHRRRPGVPGRTDRPPAHRPRRRRPGRRPPRRRGRVRPGGDPGRADRAPRSRRPTPSCCSSTTTSFDLDLVARHATLRARHPPRPARAHRRAPVSDARTESVAGGLLRAARPRQWAKNLLVFAAPAAAGVIDEAEPLADASIAFAAFCLAASGTYLLNDVADREADARHPTKRYRPIAAGVVPPGAGHRGRRPGHRRRRRRELPRRLAPGGRGRHLRGPDHRLQPLAQAHRHPRRGRRRQRLRAPGHRRRHRHRRAGVGLVLHRDLVRLALRGDRQAPGRGRRPGRGGGRGRRRPRHPRRVQRVLPGLPADDLVGGHVRGLLRLGLRDRRRRPRARSPGSSCRSCRSSSPSCATPCSSTGAAAPPPRRSSSPTARCSSPAWPGPWSTARPSTSREPTS